MRIIKKNNFKHHYVTNKSQIILNSEPTDDNHIATKSYVDSLSENDRNIRNLPTLFNDQDNEIDNIILTGLDTKRNFDAVLGKTNLRFNQTLQS